MDVIRLVVHVVLALKMRLGYYEAETVVSGLVDQSIVSRLQSTRCSIHVSLTAFFLRAGPSRSLRSRSNAKPLLLMPYIGPAQRSQYRSES